MSDRLRLEDLPPFYRAQAEAQLAIADARERRMAANQPETPESSNYSIIPNSSKPKKPKRADGYKSQLEADYARHLDSLKLAGEIDEWIYEWATFKISKNVRYTPDFALFKGNTIRFVETKGRWQADALVKFRIARDELPFKFTAVKRIQGRWVETANPVREKRKSEKKKREAV